ncbi:MAG: DUF4179 domain-containing protein [Oscillospiraceae bacterium]|nr:DUF4179 domain-containing protein [Oscillospiraceae bacterium]
MNMNLKDVFDCYNDESIRLGEAPSVSDDRVCALTNTKLGKENIIIKKVYRKLPMVLVTVFAAILLMGAGFIASSDSIDGWFKTQWEEVTGEEMSNTQYEYVASLSQYIGLSQSSDGVTVTVDSATLGDDIIYVLIYVESDNAKFAPNVSIARFDTAAIELDAAITRFSHVGTSWQYTDENGKVCLILEKTFGLENGDEPVDVTLHFEDFCAYYAEDTGLTGTFNGGVWDFEFTLERTETHLIEFTIPETWSGVYELSVSEFTLYAVYDYPSYNIYPRGLYLGNIYAITEDGTEIRTSLSYSISDPDDGVTVAQYHWAVPLDLDEIVGIRIGEEIIEIK